MTMKKKTKTHKHTDIQPIQFITKQELQELDRKFKEIFGDDFNTEQSETPPIGDKP